ncbi:MAG: hypothetical protein KC478_00385 [Bacteriovoracaceae bacterium]|nr:hypothetical protein [Bacteriovoracaceae bacterium]
MFMKSKNVCIAALAVLTLTTGGQTFAACVDSISEYEDGIVKGGTLDEFALGSTSIFTGAVASGAVPVLGGLFLAGGMSTTSTALADEVTEKARELNDSQIYAKKVMQQADYRVSEEVELASFIKFVQREVGVDKAAVIPTDEEVIEAVDAVNVDLTACQDGQGEFYVTTKESLKNDVINYIKY